MGKSAPTPPDPVATAAAQGSWNTFTAQQQQAMNMVGQNTPYGTLDYEQTGSTWMTDPSGKKIEVPNFTANVNLTPEQKAIFDKTQAAQTNLAGIAQDQSARVGEILNDPFKFDNHDAENWAFDLASQRILPQQQRNEEALRTRLTNQGIRPGSAAWDTEMARLTNANSDQLNQLALTGRQQGFSEALAQRNQPLNEIIGLMSGSQIQNPTAGFAQTPQTQVAGVDYTGLVNNNYNQQVAATNAQNGAMGGLFGTLGGAAIKYGLPLLSDARAKKNIQRVGKTDEGTPIYTYQYKGGGPIMMGVMAQELEKKHPEAVVEAPGGMKMVNYGMVH